MLGNKRFGDYVYSTKKDRERTSNSAGADVVSLQTFNPFAPNMSDLFSNRYAVLADDWEERPEAKRLPEEPKARVKAEESAAKSKVRAMFAPPEDPPFPEEVSQPNDARPPYLYWTVYHKKTWDHKVTKPMFLRWRLRTLCKKNPTDVTNPFFVEMVKTGWCGYGISKHFLGDSFVYSKLWKNPVWSFDRFGRTRTVLPHDVESDVGLLPKGTKFFIAGEHEDGSDPDFCIYNDVTVVRPDGTIKIYQYPPKDFPPTDAHTATLVPGNRIYLIGSVGYMGHRGDRAQVCVLDLATMRMTKLETAGDDPGWISHHTVTHVSADTIDIDFNGMEDHMCEASPGNWRFHTRTLRWERRPDDEDAILEEMSMDEASCRGLTSVLDYWKASGKTLDWTEKALDRASGYGLVSVLQWWRHSDLELRWSSDTMNVASMNGHVDVLRWWKASGLQCKYTYMAIHGAAMHGHLKVLEWWKTAGLPIGQYSPMDELSQVGRVEVLEWFKRSGLRLRWSHWAIDWASAYGQVEVLQWWKDSGLRCIWSRDWERLGRRAKDSAARAAVKKWWDENGPEMERRWPVRASR